MQAGSGETVPPGEAQQFITDRGGHTAGTGAPNLNPEFASRLAAAGRAYEQETGQKAQFGETGRSREQQAKYYQEFKRTGQGRAAPPGQSRHEKGLATDIPTSPDGGRFNNWMHRNASRFGLEGLRPDLNDPYHFQMSGRTPQGTQQSLRPASAPQQGGRFQNSYARTFANTPLANQYENVVRVAQANGVPPERMAAIMAEETGRGTSRILRENNNPAGLAGRGGYLKFPTLEAGIEAAGRTIGRIYQQTGGNLLGMGRIYAPPGAGNDPRRTNWQWPGAVRQFEQGFY